VEAENPITGHTVHAATAYFVFVALDAEGHPRPVPPITADSEIEQRRQRAAKLRRAARMAHQEALRAERGSDEPPSS
jgi:acyl-CoA hydrolase